MPGVFCSVLARSEMHFFRTAGSRVKVSIFNPPFMERLGLNVVQF